MTATIISVENVSKCYDRKVHALREVSLEFFQGDFVALLGPSGAGKSTLLRCLNALEKPDSGRIIYHGELELTKQSTRQIRRKTGMIFQQFHLVERLTVLENVLCGRLAFRSAFLTSLRLFPREDIELAKKCLERVGLSDKIYERADRLSGGQQQRVAIARALAQEAELILADEPVASLDPVSAKQVMNVLREINEKDRISMIVSLHNIEIAKEYAKRIVGVHDGRVVLETSGSELCHEDIQKIYGDHLNHEE